MLLNMTFIIVIIFFSLKLLKLTKPFIKKYKASLEPNVPSTIDRFPNLSGEAGAAFLLSVVPTESIIFNHPHGQVNIRKSAPYVSVVLNIKPNKDNLIPEAWKIVQESLDVLAARGRASLVTSNGDSEYIYWIKIGDSYELTFMDTSEFKWSIQAHGTVVGQPVQEEPPSFFHHESLRYYRMSKCTSDLFDAFRNTYLGFECLVSSESPKNLHEPELSWLKRVVNGPLREGVPAGIQIDPLIEKVYKRGRNPLFHAKENQTFHAPHGEIRNEIQELFEELSLLLVALIQYKFGTHVIRRWASTSQALQDNQARAFYQFDELQFLVNGHNVSAEPEVEIVQNPRRFGQLWSIIRVSRPDSLDFLKKIIFLHAGEKWMDFNVEEDIPLAGVSNIIFEINTANRNIHQPKSFHPN